MNASVGLAPGFAKIRPPSIGVLVDLEWTETAGGHVKCWEQIAKAATRYPEHLDLTVHFQGRRKDQIDLSENVRFSFLRPVLPTSWFGFLSAVPTHADLAPLQPGLFHRLMRHDVIHTTDAYFAYAATARLAAGLAGKPLVNSLHTDTAAYTLIYSEAVLRRLTGDGALSRLLIEKMALPRRLSNKIKRKLVRHEKRCHSIMGTVRGEEGARIKPVSAILRRGIDKTMFNPNRRDRGELSRTYGIDPDRIVVLYCGRIDRGKNIHMLVDAARTLADRGRPIHVVMAGQGVEEAAVKARLGDHVTLAGHLSQDRLGWLYASSDVFVFPSGVEVSPNVVLEAKASGLPVFVTPGGGGVYVRDPECDGVVMDVAAPEAWANELDRLIGDRDRRMRIGCNARAVVENHHPSWDDVLIEDLLPVWRAAATRSKLHLEYV